MLIRLLFLLTIFTTLTGCNNEFTRTTWVPVDNSKYPDSIQFVSDTIVEWWRGSDNRDTYFQFSYRYSDDSLVFETKPWHSDNEYLYNFSEKEIIKFKRTKDNIEVVYSAGQDSGRLVVYEIKETKTPNLFKRKLY